MWVRQYYLNFWGAAKVFCKCICVMRRGTRIWLFLAVNRCIKFSLVQKKNSYSEEDCLLLPLCLKWLERVKYLLCRAAVMWIHIHLIHYGNWMTQIHIKSSVICTHGTVAAASVDDGGVQEKVFIFTHPFILKNIYEWSFNLVQLPFFFMSQYST